ncbi:hypothetical protein M9Y10_038015 [Tritrichomonas musculus]|uniref:Uncharacterized protein n=1 Tax=Tritrichomonas musculus TaxID=1915356 RepID=A0ABR2K780_9EUKA
MSGNNRLEESLTRINNLTQIQPQITPKIQRCLERLYYRLQNMEVDLDKQTTIERLKLQKRRQSGNCDIKNSLAFKKLQQKGWDKFNQKELRSIAQVISKKSGISLDREAKRRREILLTWFDENFEYIKKHMDCITLEYDPSYL